MILRRLLATDTAQSDLLDYTKFTMPDHKAPDDVRRSRYQVSRVHRVIADALHDLEARKILRLIINCAPRHGKTELASNRFMAWHAGLHPEQSLIFGTYNDTFAEDRGRAVRSILQSKAHHQVFPDFRLRSGSASVQRLETSAGGILSFVGRGGSITGRGGHGLIIDDPLKGRKEADSQLLRDELWEWFTQVIASRLMDEDSWILLIQTRWHEDDLVGRITDPLNSFYTKEEAAEWTVIDLPALAAENDPLGRSEGEALWPEKFGVKFLQSQRRRDPRGFQALYQGRPSADTGSFFKAEYIKTYKQDELPANVRVYCASDHAVSTRQDRDKTCLIPVGVDELNNIYIMPEVFWRHAAADTVVEGMLNLISAKKPLFWWAERGHISKALGPFLRKRMQEEGVYASVIELTPTADKQTRAQSILGRMAMGKVFFPSWASWWPEARAQLLKFPHGANDDFVDALAYIGLGLSMQVGAIGAPASNSPRPGTFGEMFKETRARENRLSEAAAAGW